MSAITRIGPSAARVLGWAAVITCIASVTAFPQAVFQSNASGNWNASSTWLLVSGSDADGIPDADDDVQLQVEHTVTVNISNAECNSMVMGVNGTGTAILTFSGVNPQLTVVGAITVGDVSNANGRGIVNFTSGSTLIASSLTLVRSVSNGTRLDMGFGGTLRVGSLAVVTPSGGTPTDPVWVPGAGTVELTATNTLPSTIFSQFNNLTITANTTTAGVGLTVNGNLTIASGATFNAGSFTYSLKGNWVNSGTFNAQTSTFSLDGTFNQTLSGSTFYNLTVNNSQGVTLLTDETVNGTLTLTSGTLSVGSNTLTLNGPAIAGTTTNLITTSASSLSFGGSATGVSIPSSVTSLNNLTINNPNGVLLGAPLTISGTLTLTNGRLTLGGNNLTIAASGSISGGSATSYVRTNQNTAGYLVRQGVSTTTVTFPVGRSSYNPVTLRQTVDATARTYSVLVRDGVSPASGNDPAAVQRTWVILQSPVSSSTMVQYTVQWNSGEEGTTFSSTTSGGRTTTDCGPWWHNGGSWVLLSSVDYGDISSITSSGFPAVATVETKLPLGGSPWVIALRAGGLPVQLGSFTGTVIENNRVRLEWMTISEINNYGFYVQRRNVGVQEWTEIPNSFVPGHGTTNEPRFYSYTDNTPITGPTQYRLKQVDLDGTIHYSDPIQVDLPTSVGENAPKRFVLMQNYPNPFNPSTEIKFSVEQTDRAKLEVYNTLGQKVATVFDGVAEAGRFYRVQFNGSGLSSGVYLYRLESGKHHDLKKLVLVK